jgi:hypothetical protein
MSLRQRLADVERKRSGGVVLADDGAPVIQTPDGLQFNGYFVGRLKDLDPGKYRLVEGPPVSFDDFWESGKSWTELVEARP